MALTRLDNLFSSKTGKYLYVSPDDFNATDELDNRGNSPLRPFKTIQRAFIEVARYSFLPAQGGESVPDRFDQFSIMLMPGDHYIDNRPGLVDLQSGDNQRYFDAKNLITANRQEIIDRSFAEITVQYDESAWGVDWVVPGDPAVDDQNRFYDSYRLIQKNRDFIQARATGQTAIDYPDFYFPDEPQTDSSSRFATAYRLIHLNKTNIVDLAWTHTLAAYPSSNTTEVKCKRDLGWYLEYLTLDLFYGGNQYTREFIQLYFDAVGAQIANGLAGEETESLYAFATATALMKAALTNQTSVTVNSTTYDLSSWTQDLTRTADPATGSNTDPTSCSNVQTALDTLTTIVSDVFTAGNLNGLPSLNVGTANAGKAKCKRDVGFFIDAISLDIVQGGGNVYTRKYTQNYFNAGGTSWVDDGLQGEEQESIVAFNKARDLMIEAVANQLGYKDLTLTHDTTDSATYNGINYDPASCANVTSTITTLSGIPVTYFTQGSLDNFVEETVAENEPGAAKCKRDIGYIVDAVAADLGNGGNGSIIAAAKAYFDKNGIPISDGLIGEEAQSVIAFNYAGVMMKKAVTNQLYSKDLTILAGPASYTGYETNDPIVPNLPSGNSATCVDVQSSIDTLVGIISTVITDGDLDSLSSVQVTGDIPLFNYNKALQEWQDNSILDLSNPDNALYKFNSASGGAIDHSSFDRLRIYILNDSP